MPRAGDNEFVAKYFMFERSKAMTSKEQADALCYEIESHSPMVLNMTPDERTELFKAIQEAIPIVELLEVASAAEEQSKDGFMFRCDPNKLKQALQSLRAKLPKEMQP